MLLLDIVDLPAEDRVEAFRSAFDQASVPCRIEHLGPEQHLVCDVEDGSSLIARLDPDEASPAEDSTVTLTTDVDHLHLFDPVTTGRID